MDNAQVCGFYVRAVFDEERNPMLGMSPHLMWYEQHVFLDLILNALKAILIECASETITLSS